jgi:hypothetical protein
MVCAAALAVFASPATVSADPSEAAFERSDSFTNRDLLEQSERDQRLWLIGVALGLSSGVALRDQEGGECIAAWYFGDRAQSYADMRDNMERFPDHSPPVIMVALARRACPEANI